MNLINGDCLAELEKINEKSVDLVILDLPYGQTVCEWDVKINLEELWKQLKRICKPNTPYFFFTTTKFGYELIKSNEAWFRYDLVWSKTRSVGFLNAKKMPLRGHEMIYVFYENQPLYDIVNNHVRINTEGNKEYTSSSLYGTSVIKNKKQCWEPKLPTSVIDVNIGKQKRFHQTQKPVELLSWIIKYYSKENDCVLDPTMGSGSTGVACKNMNRNFIGIEKNKEIYDIAVNRLNE